MRRYLRLSVTVFCGYACVLLVALWLKSYWEWRVENVLTTSSHRYDIHSTVGSLILLKRERMMAGPVELKPDYPETLFSEVTKRRFGIGRYSDGKFTAIGVPYWLLVTLTASAAAAPWVRSRFSLRTMLIAMTVIAIVLGLAFYPGQ